MRSPVIVFFATEIKQIRGKCPVIFTTESKQILDPHPEFLSIKTNKIVAPQLQFSSIESIKLNGCPFNFLQNWNKIRGEIKVESRGTQLSATESKKIRVGQWKSRAKKPSNSCLQRYKERGYGAKSDPSRVFCIKLHSHPHLIIYTQTPRLAKKI